MEIKGNIESLKKSTIEKLKALYDIQAGRDEFIPDELVRGLAEITGITNREIAAYLNRKGNVLEIIVGDSNTVSLVEFDGKRSKSRLSGIRCIHTHPNGDPMLSEIDINALKSMKLDAMIAVGVREGLAVSAYAAIPAPPDGKSPIELYGPFKPPFKPSFYEEGRLFELIYERDGLYQEMHETGRDENERAILVGLELQTGNVINGKSEGQRSLDELKELSETAGLEVVDSILQKRVQRDAAFYIGRGKIEQLGLMLQATGSSVLVFDDELSGAQIRNIEEVTGAKAIDRTALILDIFAQRARSSEGKLQVELAQLKYRLPRLMGMGGQLSRLGGGIGTRGPGEKKLETDRRHIRRRISNLNDELENVTKRRNITREQRKQNEIPVIALVGYTNSGKSTLLNTLCNADVFAEDKLFATLDPSARKLVLPDGRLVLLVDTVGFIKKLPHELIEAFKSTLEEVVYADLLLHIVDASDEELQEKVEVVESILAGLGALEKPMAIVFNKMDIAAQGNERLPFQVKGLTAVEVSALRNEGIDRLMELIMKLIPKDEIILDLTVPYNKGWVVPYIHENGMVISEEYLEEGVRISAKIKQSKADKLREINI